MKQEIYRTLLGASVLLVSFSAFGINRPHVVVRYYNEAKLNARVVDQAMRIASEVFDHTDVSLDWQDGCAGRGRCKLASEAGINLVILSSRERMHPCSARAGSCARRFDGGISGTIYILYDRAEVTAQLIRDSVGADSTSALALVVGCYMAHEIGHLALHDAQHAASGLMMGRLGSKEWWSARKGTLSFAPEESAVIQRRVSAGDQR